MTGTPFEYALAVLVGLLWLALLEVAARRIRARRRIACHWCDDEAEAYIGEVPLCLADWEYALNHWAPGSDPTPYPEAPYGPSV